jgi:predicted N-formylglutamate amidohydrolase
MADENARTPKSYESLGLLRTEEMVDRHATVDVGVLVPLHSALCESLL